MFPYSFPHPVFASYDNNGNLIGTSGCLGCVMNAENREMHSLRCPYRTSMHIGDKLPRLNDEY